jgi:hypothetical protein
MIGNRDVDTGRRWQVKAKSLGRITLEMSDRKSSSQRPRSPRNNLLHSGSSHVIVA